MNNDEYTKNLANTHVEKMAKHKHKESILRTAK